MAKKDIGGLITLFLLCVVGMALTPIIQEQVTVITWANNGTAGFPPLGYNLTGSARTIMLMFPLFWVILMIAIPVAGVAVYLKK